MSRLISAPVKKYTCVRRTTDAFSPSLSFNRFHSGLPVRDEKRSWLHVLRLLDSVTIVTVLAFLERGQQGFGIRMSAPPPVPARGLNLNAQAAMVVDFAIEDQHQPIID